jgi:hypothetical protein
MLYSLDTDNIVKQPNKNKYMEQRSSWRIKYHSLSQNSLPVLEPENSLPSKEKPATSFYLQAHEVIHKLQFYFLRIHFNIILTSAHKF